MNNPIIKQGSPNYTKSKNVKYHRKCDTCGKEYTGWGKYFCKPTCKQFPKLNKSPHWKKNTTNVKTGRQRAWKMFKLEPCEVCGSKKSERHHIDGNTLNNVRKNIMFLCRKHHIAIEGRAIHMWLARHLSSSEPNP